MTNRKIWKTNKSGHFLLVNDEQVAWLMEETVKIGVDFKFRASYGNVDYINHELKSKTLEEAKKEVERILLAGYSEFVAELKKEIEKYNKLVQVLYAREATKESSGEDDAE